MANNDHDISTLNGLITTTLDSAEGYTEAAKDNESGRFASIFTSRAAERQSVARDLQAEVTRLGGEPSTSGSALGSAHRVFANLKAAITGKDEQAIVNEVERGEDHIKAKFEKAMEDTEMSPGAVSAITVAYRSVREGHDQMRDLKHALQAAN